MRNLRAILYAATVVAAACTGPVSAAAERPAAHAEARCAGCHDGGAAAAVDPTAVVAVCTDCHRPTSFRGSQAAVHRRARERCLDCHGFHAAVEPAVTRPLPIAGDLDSGHCRSCHAPGRSLNNISAAHRAAAELYHLRSADLAAVGPSEACLFCHDESSDSPWRDATPHNEIVFNPHGSHPFGVRYIPGKGNSSNWLARDRDERLPLFDGKVECQSCHQLTAGTEDLVIPFPAKYDMCKGCHRQYGDEAGSALVARAGR